MRFEFARRGALLACAMGLGFQAFLGWSHSLPAIETEVLERSRSSITSDELEGHVLVLADDTFEGREAGTRGGHAAGGYITDFLDQQGLQGGAEDGSFYQVFGEGYRNILAILPGSDPLLSEEYVLIGAHYDHVGYGTPRNSYGPTGYIHNGADDNASGVSALMEVIDAMANHGVPPRRSVIFAFWDGEEKGLLGSKHWVANPTVSLEQIELAMNMDMVGRLRPQGCDIFGSRSAPGLREFVSRQNRDVDLLLNFTWELKDNSDHYSFIEAEIPVIMFHTGLHDDYHRPRDDAEKINFEGMQSVSQLILNVVYSATDTDTLPDFRSAARLETPEAEEQYGAELAPLPPRLGILWDPGDQEPGILITRVTRGTPAYEGGLRRGDRLITMDGEELTNAEFFRELVQLAHGEVEATVSRPNQEELVTLTLPMPAMPVRWGISWRENDGEPGVITLVRVSPGTPAASCGLAVGDRIYEINGQRFESSADFSAKTGMLEGPTGLLIERRGQLQLLEINLPPLIEELPDDAEDSPTS